VPADAAVGGLANHSMLTSETAAELGLEQKFQGLLLCCIIFIFIIFIIIYVFWGGVLCCRCCFLACTPERLYVRSGRQVASEAVAGTAARGPPGDLEADFYQVSNVMLTVLLCCSRDTSVRNHKQVQMNGSYISIVL